MGLTLLSEGLVGFWLCEFLNLLLYISRWINGDLKSFHSCLSVILFTQKIRILDEENDGAASESGSTNTAG